MRQLGLKPSETELEDLMNEIDTDRSGTISFEGNVESCSLLRFSSYQKSALFNTLSNIDMLCNFFVVKSLVSFLLISSLALACWRLLSHHSTLFTS